VWQKRSAEIVIEYGEILERKSFRYPPEKRIFVPQKIQLFSLPISKECLKKFFKFCNLQHYLKTGGRK